MNSKRISELRELEKKIPDNVLGNADSAYVGISHTDLANLLNALPEALDEIETCHDTLDEVHNTVKYFEAELEALQVENERLRNTLKKIAEAERMGYGTQHTYGEMARKALEEK